MSNLHLTPTMRSDGVATHVWKKDESASAAKPNRTKSVAPAPPKVTNDIPESADPKRDFIKNVTDITDNSTIDESWEARQEIEQWAKDVAEKMDKHPQYLPEVEPDYDEDPDAEYAPIKSVKELRKPSVSEDQCFYMARGVAQFARDVLGQETKLVQGVKEYNPDAGIYQHYATLVTASNGVSMVVDYTFSQFDKKAPFPLVEKPDIWLARVKDTLKKKAKKRKSNSWDDYDGD